MVLNGILASLALIFYVVVFSLSTHSAYRIDMPNAGQRRITGSIEQIAMDNWEIDIRGEIKCQ